MRSIAKLMQDWQFTGPDGKTTLVALPDRKSTRLNSSHIL